MLISADAEASVRPLLLKAAHVLAFEDLQQLEFKPPSDSVYQAVTEAAGLPSEDGKRVQSLIVAGRYLDDAFVYSL